MPLFIRYITHDNRRVCHLVSLPLCVRYPTSVRRGE